MNQTYPEMRHDLQSTLGRLRRKAPEVMKALNALHDASYSDGALTEKHKELIALGIAITQHCDGCIAFHTYQALTHDATQQEIIECIAVAMQMGGGPATIYAAHALQALEQFSETRPTT